MDMPRPSVPVGGGPYQPRPGELGETPETPGEAQGQGPSVEWNYWHEEIDAALRHERRFRKEGEKAEELVFGDEAKTFDEWGCDQTHIIASTIETMKPLIYADTPDPIVRRRFRGDGKVSPVERLSAEVVERLARHLISTCPFDDAMEAIRDDWLTPGRGSGRVMYRAEWRTETVEGMDPATGMPTRQEIEKKAGETVYPRHWPWRRFLVSPVATKAEIRWYAYLSFLTRDQMATRFGDDVAGRVSYTHAGKAQTRSVTENDGDGDMWGARERETLGSGPTPSSRKQCAVWEIWDRTDRTVKWWSPDFKEALLDTDADPLDLKDFWDTPGPLLAITKNDSLTPRSEIAYMHGRAREIDLATAKLAAILDKIAVAGVYPGSLQNVLRDLLDGKNKLVAVENWLAFADKAGTNAGIQWLPIDMFVQAAQALYQMREQSKMMLYESTGISDIVRGQGDPNETATAQQIKGRFAGMRVGQKQARFARYVRDMIRLMVDAALGMFDLETLVEICALDLPMTEQERLAPLMEFQQAQAAWQMQAQQAEAMGQEPPPPPQEPRLAEASWEQIEPFVRDDFRRFYRIDIETDSTLLVDEEADRDARVEFLSAFTGFVSSLLPLARQGGVDFKIVKELLLFGVRGFRQARTLEGMIEALPDEIDTTPPEDVQVTVAKIRAEAALEVARINGQVDLEEQALENEGDVQTAQVRAAGAERAALMRPRPNPQQPQGGMA